MNAQPTIHPSPLAQDVMTLSRRIRTTERYLHRLRLRRDQMLDTIQDNLAADPAAQDRVLDRILSSPGPLDQKLAQGMQIVHDFPSPSEGEGQGEGELLEEITGPLLPNAREEDDPPRCPVCHHKLIGDFDPDQGEFFRCDTCHNNFPAFAPRQENEEAQAEASEMARAQAKHICIQQEDGSYRLDCHECGQEFTSPLPTAHCPDCIDKLTDSNGDA